MKRALMVALCALSFPAHAALQFFDETTGTAAVWRVGDPSPEVVDYSYGDAMECSAFGAELSYIQAHFVGLRMHNAPVPKGQVPQVFWTGEDCEFILNNL